MVDLHLIAIESHEQLEHLVQYYFDWIAVVLLFLQLKIAVDACIATLVQVVDVFYDQ